MPMQADLLLTGGSLVIAALVTNELLGWRSRAGVPRIQTLSADACESQTD